MKLKKIVLCVLSVAALFPMAGGVIAGDSPESSPTTSDVEQEAFKSAMVPAIEEGDLESVKRYIEREFVSIDETIADEGYTPLQLAASEGQLEIVKWLVEQGADINAVNDVDTYYANPITYAAIRGFNTGDWKVVRYLAELPGIDINYSTRACEWGSGSNALTFACDTKDNNGNNGNLGIVRFLVDHGADPCAKDEWEDLNAIEMAVLHNQDEIFDYFVEERHVKIENPTDLLDIAIANSNSHAVRYLLDHGANFRNIDGAIFKAVNSGDVNIVGALVREGATAHERDVTGKTPLHIAAQNGNKAIIEFLISGCGARVDARDNDGRTSLHLAADKGNLEAVECLLRYDPQGANAEDRGGHKPFALAQQGNIRVGKTPNLDLHPDLIEKLLEYGRILATLGRRTHYN